MLDAFFENMKTRNTVRRYQKRVHSIRQEIDSIHRLDDVNLIARSQALLASREAPSIEQAFAIFYEALRRVKQISAYDVQLHGAIALTEGQIAEMKTGEGKTYVAPFAAYYLALQGLSVHIMTVNDYLAERDANLLRPVFAFLGMDVDYLKEGKWGMERQQAYRANVLYGKPSEFAFDYLRDNMARSHEERVQRSFGAILIDEVDSILIDEARTPLIISSLGDRQTEAMDQLAPMIEDLSVLVMDQEQFLSQFDERKNQEPEGVDVCLERKSYSVKITEAGYHRLESHLLEQGVITKPGELYGPASHYIMIATSMLRAKHLLKIDHDYIVREGEVVLIDPQTGRLRPGNRLSDGQHQAIEFYEGVEVNADTQTAGSITMVAYVQMYQHLAGMTGTAYAERQTFQSLYGLSTHPVPTHRPVQRIDHPDRLCLTESGMLKAVLRDISEAHTKGQPVLVGTDSVEMSQRLSDALDASELKHNVLNAKNHAREAEIIADAGRPGAITISTAMAGRGTDILLGGHCPESPDEKTAYEDEKARVLAAGGLRVIGVGRALLRRMDEQLQGRAGRQGDPGESVFYVSLDDPLIKRYASPTMVNMIRGFCGDDEESFFVNTQINTALRRMQARVEMQQAEERQHHMRFDNVITQQRLAIYELRDSWLFINERSSDELHDRLRQSAEAVIQTIIDEHIPSQSMSEQWDLNGLTERLNQTFKIRYEHLQSMVDSMDVIDELHIREQIGKPIMNTLSHLKRQLTSDLDSVREYEVQMLKRMVLNRIDRLWQQHLSELMELQKSINLRAYANQKPVNEYAKEAFGMFASLLAMIEEELACGYMSALIVMVNELKRIQAEAQAA
jgi:preprotein translocase subunit SecA